MTRPRILILAMSFLLSVIFQPHWVTDNFWNRADFWKFLPFNFPYMGFILMYAGITTLIFDQFIRFAKKYA